MQFSYNLKEAKAFSEIGCIEEWVHIFLKTKGGNKALSDGLKLQRRFWLRPIALPISELTRCCGPEPEMEYYNDPNDWEKHIAHFCQLLENGWEPGPLFAEHKQGKLFVRDGNHRLEAMHRLGRAACWVIIWENDDPALLTAWSQKEVHTMSEKGIGGI